VTTRMYTAPFAAALAAALSIAPLNAPADAGQCQQAWEAIFNGVGADPSPLLSPFRTSTAVSHNDGAGPALYVTGATLGIGPGGAVYGAIR